jgi:hypothetical protein
VNANAVIRILLSNSAVLAILCAVAVAGFGIESAVASTPAKIEKKILAKNPTKISGLEAYEKMAESLGDERVPRLKRVEQFERMVSVIVEKTNELSTQLSPEEIDRVLPLFELKALVSEIPMDRVRERKCNVALNQVLATAGPNVQGPKDLNPVGRFVYETLGKICN